MPPRARRQARSGSRSHPRVERGREVVTAVGLRRGPLRRGRRLLQDLRALRLGRSRLPGLRRGRRLLRALRALRLGRSRLPGLRRGRRLLHDLRALRLGRSRLPGLRRGRRRRLLPAWRRGRLRLPALGRGRRRRLLPAWRRGRLRPPGLGRGRRGRLLPALRRRLGRGDRLPLLRCGSRLGWSPGLCFRRRSDPRGGGRAPLFRRRSRLEDVDEALLDEGRERRAGRELTRLQVIGDAVHVALAVHREQGPPLIGRERDVPLVGRSLGEPEPRAVVWDDLADRDDAIALLDRLVEQLIEVAGEIRRRRVGPGDELEGTVRDREHHAERRLAGLLAGDGGNEPPAVESERAARAVGAADLELAGLARRVDELDDRLDRE